MIFPDVPTEDWAKRNSLEIETDRCDSCDCIRKTTIPFVERDWVGLMAPPCSCGESGDLSIQRPRRYEITKWAQSFEQDVSRGLL